jgi:hypothetical protein
VVLSTVDINKYKKWISQFMPVDNDQLPSLVIFHPYPETVYKPTEQPQSLTQLQSMISEVVHGKRTPVSTVAWYHPGRYLRQVERWISRFSDAQLIGGAVGASVLLFGAMAYWALSGKSWEGESVMDRLEDKVSRAREAAPHMISHTADMAKGVSDQVLEKLGLENEEDVEVKEEPVIGEDDPSEDEEVEEEVVTQGAVARKTRSRKE